jgi:hypothetical protein
MSRGFRGKPERKGPLGKSRRGREDDIKIYSKEIGWTGVELINLAHDRAKGPKLINAVMNFLVP